MSVDTVALASYDIEDATLELIDALLQSRGLDPEIPERAIEYANEQLQTLRLKIVRTDGR